MQFTTDAQEASLAFVRKQLSVIEPGVYRTVYPDVQYAQLVPVDTSAPEWTRTVQYFSSDEYGTAGWINGNSDDVPTADVSRAVHETGVAMAGVGYVYGWAEVEQARQSGVNLPDEKAQAARRAYENFVDKVALRGDTEKGYTGLLDYPGITAAPAVTGDWATATEDQILGDVNAAILGIATDTLYTGMGDTLLLPYDKLNVLATRRLGDTGQTVLGFLRANNTYTAMTGQALTIRAVRGLETAGAGDTARMVVYRRSPDVLKLHIPMPHRFLPVHRTGAMNFVVPGVFRLGGLDVRRPKEVRYIDGI